MDFRLPDVLEPKRDEPPSAERYRKACLYGQQLWHELAETRRYLRDAIAGGEQAGVLDKGPLLAQARHWQDWADRYEHICSVLAGSSGDNGFGRSEATLIARVHGVEIGHGIRA